MEFKFAHLIKASLITSFTIAVALIWKDFILNFLHFIFPVWSMAIYYEFLVAVVATAFLVVVLYFILLTEKETEFIFKKLKKHK